MYSRELAHGMNVGKIGTRPKYRDAIAYIPREGERRGRGRREYNRVAKSGREGDAEKRWAAGPLLLSRAHFLEKFFEDSWME